jgi:hypothetical protein
MWCAEREKKFLRAALAGEMMGEFFGLGAVAAGWGPRVPREIVTGVKV